MARGRKPKGLGDVVENITQATGIDKVVKAIVGDHCGCDERKEYLNRLFPFSPKVRGCLTDEQREYLTAFFASVPSTIHTIQQCELAAIYDTLFGIKIDTNCARCWRSYINDIKKIYDANPEA